MVAERAMDHRLVEGDVERTAARVPLDHGEPLLALVAPASCPGSSHRAGHVVGWGRCHGAPVALAALSMLGLTLREDEGDGQQHAAARGPVRGAGAEGYARGGA